MALPPLDTNSPLTINLHGQLTDFAVPKVMGIVNATPDSFYQGSRVDATDAAERIAAMCRDGADWLDIGAYSSRQGADDIDADEEFARLAPVLATARKVAPTIPLSVDTFRASVAARCIEEFGVEMINDISGGTLDPEIADVAAEYHVAYVLMHMRGTPQTMQQLTDYTDVTADVVSELAIKIGDLRQLGIADIVVDPGFGFAKTTDQNYELLAHLQEFKMLGAPLLVGLSRKSMIYKPLGTTPDGALAGTVALNTFALLHGADILRVHDVKEARQTIELLQLIRNHNYQ